MPRKTILIMTVASLAAGCTVDPNYRNTASGAGIGALGGGLVGALVSHNKGTGALIGAGIGALAGGAVGNYMDTQERELRAKMRGTGVDVVRDGDNIRLILPGGVTFRTGSSEIQPQFFGPLNDVAHVLTQYPQSLVSVVGHTDNVGSPQMNQQLSERRAEAVAEYLRAQGVVSERLNAYGRGETQPIATNSTDVGRQQNRRVEINIEPYRG